MEIEKSILVMFIKIPVEFAGVNRGTEEEKKERRQEYLHRWFSPQACREIRRLVRIHRQNFVDME
jgi:hypothetical protein